MNQGSQETIDQTVRNQAIQQFYQEYGIKQKSSFSGGFKYQEKNKETPLPAPPPQEQTKEDLYKHFGVSRKANFPEFYKVDKDYVPQTKSELADKLMEKLEHQMKKMKYYRQKYVPYQK